MALLMMIRHGRTSGNSSGRFIGQHDEWLDEEGERQAALLVPMLTRFNPDRVISSDLKRCTQTMAPFAEASGVMIETDPGLREVGDGEWTNMSPEELWAGWPDLMERYANGEDVPRPGGERWADVRRRVLASVSRIVGEMGPDDKVVVCTHAGPSMLISSWVTGTELPGNIFLGQFRPPSNAAVTMIDPHPPALISYNETCHLSANARVLGGRGSGVALIR
ncbi:MAG: histidine phosphatase family protein [Actinomycetia bacterium]|nr:histidine phosphatase family protein [Actinomycetes bacterium]